VDLFTPENEMNAANGSEEDRRYEQLSARLVEANKTVEQLALALRSNRDIGAAIGILMAIKRVTQQQAFELLRHASQILNVKLRDLAQEVIHTGTLPAAGDGSAIACRPIPSTPASAAARLQSGVPERIRAAIKAADLRDVAAAARSSASWKRVQAAQLRHESASARGLNADLTADLSDRQCELEDRNAEALDNVWTSRDGDAAACDRALLTESPRWDD
jgi:hypothetical protein